MMIQSLLDGSYERVRLTHVRMAFSSEMSDIGKASGRKVAHLARVLGGIFRARLEGAQILYYPPAGSDTVPVIRDLVLLIPVRWMFRHTVFHFHAGGLSDLYARTPRWCHAVLNLAYGRPDVAILLSPASPPDGQAIKAVREVVVPNGIADVSDSRGPRAFPNSETVRLLFVGVLRESKGVNILIEAVRLLRRDNIDVVLDLVGQPANNDYALALRRERESAGLTDAVRFRGVLTGQIKRNAYEDADIFCFPSFFEAENLSVVCIEAMQHSLPIVATRWRALPNLVRDGENGITVPTCDAAAVALAVKSLIADPDATLAMGRRGREMYEAGYTVERFRQRIEDVFVSLMD